MELDKSALNLINYMNELKQPSFDKCDIKEIRLFSKKVRADLQPEPLHVRYVKDLLAITAAQNIPIRTYRNHELNCMDTALIFFHGGGFALDDLDSYDIFCRQLSNIIGCTVISVAYRKSPEHKFPAAVIDAIESIKWIVGNAATLGIDPKKICLCGDSVGGNLATVASIALKDNSEINIALQILLYPATDYVNSYPSKERFANGYLLTKQGIDYYADLYLENNEQAKDWRVSPVLAPNLSNLPDALVITAGFDPLVDEGELYALLMAQHGNSVTLKRYPGQIHGFITRGKLIPEYLNAIEDISNFINNNIY